MGGLLITPRKNKKTRSFNVQVAHNPVISALRPDFTFHLKSHNQSFQL